MKKKSIVLLLALGVMVGSVVGGTLAWLNAKSDTVTNVFTTSDIGVTLTETDATYKMIPGWNIAKDPKATVTSGSEDCYLFVKVEKSENFDTYMDMAIDTQWTALNGVNDVYYMEIGGDSQKDVAYNVLGEGTKIYNSVDYTWADNEVLVKPTVTEAMMGGLTVDTWPTLTFTAYATQLMKNNTTKFTPTEAWTTVSAEAAAE